MNKMENILELNHDTAAKTGTALTDVFKTPDGLSVQVYGRVVTRGKTLSPEFSIVGIQEE